MALTNACRELHCLPRSGGWLDQDCFLTEGMDLVIMEQQAKEAEEQHKRELEANRRR